LRSILFDFFFFKITKILDTYNVHVTGMHNFFFPNDKGIRSNAKFIILR